MNDEETIRYWDLIEASSGIIKKMISMMNELDGNMKEMSELVEM